MISFERPKGYIDGWYGNLPDGWIVCDGENGTPNLSKLPIAIALRPEEYRHLTIGGDILEGGVFHWIMKQ